MKLPTLFLKIPPQFAPSLQISNSSIAAQTDKTCSRPAPTDSDRSDVISLATASVTVLMLLTVPEACVRMEHSFICFSEKIVELFAYQILSRITPINSSRIQARATRLPDEKLDAFWTSPLLRAKELLLRMNCSCVGRLFDMPILY
ncbi:hypothetical protein QL285_034654 [Trifolium repens]|nr:hypothetical protein QL285_034654 [Trifolium repens]